MFKEWKMERKERKEEKGREEEARSKGNKFQIKKTEGI